MTTAASTAFSPFALSGPASRKTSLPTLDEALARDKREGLELAVRARWITIAALAPLMLYLNGAWESLYYLALLAVSALIAWAHLKVGSVGRSRPELLLLVCDIALITFALVVPNPLRADIWPAAMQYRFGGIAYFYLLLATAVLAYSWRTLVFMILWVVVAWVLGIVWVMWSPVAHPGLSQHVAEALSDAPGLAAYLDPNGVNIPNRVQELVVFVLVAATLAIASWRSNRLVRRQAETERERSNLARYFSPNVVETLAQNDTPLKDIRAQSVAVLFVDIVGFTAYADAHAPATVIRSLRKFLKRMEREVFRHDGTLDKYLGDGLMATFGTPVAGDNDAVHALRAGRAMLAAVARWNETRVAAGEEPLAIGIGVHYGPVVTGDIGASRLELAVIGATVNIASRLEAQCRVIGVPMVVSADLIERARSEPDWRSEDEAGLEPADPQMIRGVAQPVRTWVVES
jgi:adenylate cyclase